MRKYFLIAAVAVMTAVWTGCGGKADKIEGTEWETSKSEILTDSTKMEYSWELVFLADSKYKMRFVGKAGGELWKDEERTDNYTFKDGKGTITQLGQTGEFVVDGNTLTIIFPEVDNLVMTKRK